MKHTHAILSKETRTINKTAYSSQCSDSSSTLAYNARLYV